MTIETARNLGNILWLDSLEKQFLLAFLQDAADPGDYLTYLHRISLSISSEFRDFESLDGGSPCHPASFPSSPLFCYH